MRGRLLVDLAALTANYADLCALHAGDTAAVVKADAYGLGAATVAPALAQAGCGIFFVAQAEEGAALRPHLPNAAIYVFEGPTDQTAAQLAAADLIPVINNPQQLQAWRRHANRPMAIHVDTGIGRLGFDHDVTPGLFADFSPTLLLTHLACADVPDHPNNRLQLERFVQVAQRFPDLPTSIGNSAGMQLGAEFCGDVARPGIGLYSAGHTGQRRCVASLQGLVLQVRDHPSGSTIGYGASYTTDRPARIATVGLGYADGVIRSLSNRGQVGVGGVRCPVVGRVSMDLTLVDVTGANAASGDWVEFFGPTIELEQVAELAGTIDYEVLTGVSPRVQRIYQ